MSVTVNPSAVPSTPEIPVTEGVTDNSSAPQALSETSVTFNEAVAHIRSMIPAQADQEAIDEYRGWVEACKQAGAPLCFETRQPIAGRDVHIKRVATIRHIFGHGYTYRVAPCLGVETRAVWDYNDNDEYICLGEEPVDYDTSRNVTRCSSCECRYVGKKRATFNQRMALLRGKPCSPFCQRLRDRENARTRYAEKREAERAPRECQTCGETFEPTRSDAAYCSGACKQKAYRRRVSS